MTTDYKHFQYPQLDSDERLKQTVFTVNKVVIYLVSSVLVFYFINTFFILKLPLDNGFYRLVILLLSQVFCFYILKKWNYKSLALYNLLFMYSCFFLYPFLNISRRFEENVYLPLVLLIFAVTLPILYYNTKKDHYHIFGWLILIFSTVGANLYYQYTISSPEQYKFFVLFIDYPMSILGFSAAIAFLVSLLYNYRKYNHEQHDTLLKLNNSLNSKLIQIFEMNNEKETQNEELKSIQEELLAINDELENKVALRSDELKNQQKELVKFAFMNSHILRAPIARIKGLTSLFENAKKKKDQKIILKLMKESIEELDNSSKSINEVILNKDDDQLTAIESKVEQLYGSSSS